MNSNEQNGTENQGDLESGYKSGFQPIPWRKILKPLASLQLTVVLLGLSVVLVFFGTLAQTREPNWHVVETYFRSWMVWIDIDLVREFDEKFFHLLPTKSGPEDKLFSIPFPAGKLIGFTMLINLLAAHAVRFKLSWKRSGVIVIHLGMIVLMVSELLTGMFAIESNMILKNGEKANFVDIAYKPFSSVVELVLIDSEDPVYDQVIMIPGEKLTKGNLIQDVELPVDILITDYSPNSELESAPEDEHSLMMKTRSGQMIPAKAAKAPEFSSISEHKFPAPLVQFKVLKKGQPEELGSFELSLWGYPNFSNRSVIAPRETVTVDGKKYRLELRNKRIILPYTIELLEFQQKNYENTQTAKEFSSRVRIIDEEFASESEVVICMNEPLRYRGLTFFQSSALGDGTGLQVVKNPSWLGPYIACIMVTFGMLIHFVMGLINFIIRRFK